MRCRSHSVVSRLDEAARALRLDGVEQALQPIVFDLLVYLVAQRARVVPKEELLDKVWSGISVTDSSLQRAVSMLRATLREGGLPNAVQTFARRGYRFCEELGAASGALAPSDAPAHGGALAPSSAPLDGRALAAAGQWDLRARRVLGPARATPS